jgi:DNA repair exonuclease SbcCD nuclease subunit
LNATGTPQRADEIYSTFNWINKLVKKYNIGHVIFGGDLFNSVSDLKLPFVKLALDGFNLIEADIYILDGNHDYSDKNFYATSLFKYVTKEIIHEPNSTFIPSLGVRFAYLPFCRNLEEAKNNIVEVLKYDEPTIAFMHQGIEGKCYDDLAVPANLFDKPNVKRVFCGHYHFSFEEGKIVYPGSMFSCNFLDENPRKVVIYDVDTDELIYEENPACSYFISLTQKLINENMEKLLEVAKSTYLRVELMSANEDLTIPYEFLEKFRGYVISSDNAKKEFVPQYTYVDSSFTAESPTTSIEMTELDFNYETYKSLILNTRENQQYVEEHKINKDILEEALKTSFQLGI